MQKVGLDCIHEHGHRLKKLPPLVAFYVCSELNPLWGFEHCPLTIGALKLLSIRDKTPFAVDGNKFFLPLAKLPRLNTLQTNMVQMHHYIYEHSTEKTAPLMITNGLKSLEPLQSLDTLANFYLSGMETFSDIQHLKKLKTLIVSLKDDEIVPFFKTIKSESLQQLEITLAGTGYVPNILDEVLYESFKDISERLPKLFNIQGTDYYNILFNYSGIVNDFAAKFHRTMGRYFSDKYNKKVKPRK